MDTIRIVLASGNPAELSELECILTQAEEMEVAAIARSGLEAIQVVKKHAPDIFLLEIRLPDMDASEVIRRLQDAESTAHIVILSGFHETDENTIQFLIRMGIRGYLTKGEVTEWLFPILRAVMQGAVCVSPLIRELLSNFSRGPEFQMRQS